MKKSIIAILMTTIFILSMIAPAMIVHATTDPSDWYMTTKGVLATDYYSLYPYETDTSLNVGFSKFGELINGQTNTGLEFGAVDSFAPPAGTGFTSQVPKHMWVQGWFMNITYIHRTLGPRNVWAMAMFSDSINYGNDWIRVDFSPADRSTTYGLEDPRDPGSLIYGAAPYNSAATQYGGRKTNGTAVTEAINVLYDGPREFIAELRTTIYDHPLFGDNNTESDIGLVQLCITIVFDKVKKEVNLLKDVKSILVLKEGEKMKIQFSNRGEVDLGTDAQTYASYAHFYTDGVWSRPGYQNDTVAEGQQSKYNSDYVLVQTQTPQVQGQEYPYFSAAGPYPQDTDPTVDVAQAINSRAGYVWYAAFWPSTSDWTIDGWDNWWHSLMAYDPHYVDLRATIEEPSVPFYIGEWDFELYFALDVDNRTQFRGVTEYGTVYLHDATDEQMDVPNNVNVIDSEVQYYLNQTFNPWDLSQAADKYTKRFVEFPAFHASSYTTVRFPVKNTGTSWADWAEYGVFSERIEDLNTGYLLQRGEDYSVTYNANGKATFTFGSNTYHLKVLYSTDAIWSQSNAIIDPFVFSDSYTDVTNGTTENLYDSDYQTWTDPVGAEWTVAIDDFDIDTTLIYANEHTPALNMSTWTFSRDLYGWAEDFEVFKSSENPAGFTGSWDFEDLAPLANDNVSIALNLIDVHWYVTAPEFQDLYVSMLTFNPDLDITVTFNHTSSEMTVTATLDFDYGDGITYAYMEDQMGRYEWVTVGRNAATVDSAGAALVAEAYDSYKEVQIGISGEDMFGATYDVQIPSVMAKFGAGTTVADYKDAPGVGNEVGYRAALVDDWCTYWPVSTANLIAVGGPLAHVLSYYSNDFTSAFYGIPQFSGSEYSGTLTGIACWNRGWAINDGLYNVYSSAVSTRYGYAIVSTYIDINGTEVLEVYGHFARDTYYACQWLHGDLNRGILPGLVQLQDAPAGLTSIILKINYSDAKHPTFSIVECLGTISERLWYHEWSQPFWTDSAYSATGATVTTPTLQSGTTYRIVASEIFWYDYANHLQADAMYYTTATSEWNWVNHFPAPDGHSFLQMNGADVNWGPFSNGDTGHTYSIEYIGQGAPITFQIVDWMDQDYANNTCHIPISISIVEYKGGIHDP
jgi:hypothetical protein